MNLEQKYADILNTVTNIQQAAQSTTLARKHQELGDYALLGSVGQLVGSRIWRLNELGYQSVSRQGFTTWVMQALLPSIWDQFRVTGCDNQLEVTCAPPPNGPNMQSYGGGNFTGVLPKQSPCSQACGKHACVTICSWTDLSPDAAHLVFAPIATKCTYSPGDGGSWIYPANGTPGGCSLGAASALFSNSGGWKLQTNQINVGGGTVGATITEKVIERHQAFLARRDTTGAACSATAAAGTGVLSWWVQFRGQRSGDPCKDAEKLLTATLQSDL